MLFLMLAAVGAATEAVYAGILGAEPWSWGQRFSFLITAWVVLHILYWHRRRLLDRLMYRRHGAFYGVQKELASLGDEFGGAEEIRRMMAQDPVVGPVKVCHFVISWAVAIGCGLWVAF